MKHFLQTGIPLTTDSITNPAPEIADVLDGAVADCKALFDMTQLTMVVVTLGEAGVVIAERQGKFTYYQAGSTFRHLSSTIWDSTPL